MLRNRPHQSLRNGGPPMTPNQLRLRASSHEDLSTTNCHAPNPGPTGMTDPNRVRDARPCTGTLYLIFFLKPTGTCGYGPPPITESKYYIHITESHLQIQTLLLHYKSEHGTYM